MVYELRFFIIIAQNIAGIKLYCGIYREIIFSITFMISRA